MRILVVTSSSAYELAREVVKHIKDHEVVIYRLNYPIASLMTTSYIAEELSGKIKDRYDYVIIPGLTIGDASVLKDVVIAEVIKGPKYLGDLPDVIKFLELGVKFSTRLAADEVIKDYLTVKYGLNFRNFAGFRYGFEIGGVKVPLRPPPMNIFYEVMVREDGDYLRVLERIKKALGLGVDAVIIGLPVDCRVSINTLMDLIQEIRSNLRKPVGIDVQTSDLIKYLRVDPDLVVNVSLDNINLLRDYKDKAIVLVPTTTAAPDTLSEVLKKSVEEVVKAGFSKIILDVVLRPLQLGFIESLVSYYFISKELNYPLMMGLSNVYELLDADTHSVIALLTSTAMELGVSVLLITEESRKSVNAVNEVVKAREMVYRAYARKSPPIDVGVDLLIVKEKRYRGVKVPETHVDTYSVLQRVPPKIEDLFYFKIYVDEVRKNVVVDVYSTKAKVCVRRYVGSDPLSLCRAISEDFPTLSKDHYSYLGYELCKAEMALRLGRSYLQDCTLFDW